ncbi:YPDG domain-containing protein [Corynebacterium sp. ACRQP]|uniref:YPDG domain-containing protein n=1 Tax=Corynebacterium sp. ACRQP TaxID=2918195 RepID=UPI001EF74D36|nr:YPDG domain-containing protein [Corynebacterium sp. ACRQP]MCG7235513.1 YPDG domain-containing protein [Corynebacterium sp. ACRQP]
MTGKHDRAIVRRRGTSVAACALGLSLVVTGVQPVAAPQTASQAAAADNTFASVGYPKQTLRIGESVVVEPKLNLTARRLQRQDRISSFQIASDLSSGWSAEVDETTGVVTVSALAGAGDDAPESTIFFIRTTFADGTSLVSTVELSLATDPQFDPVQDKAFLVGKDIPPVHIRAIKVPFNGTLTAQLDTLPPGLWLDTSRAVGRYHHVYLKGSPTTAGRYEVRAIVADKSSGQPLVGSDGNPVEKVFTVTVYDLANLPAAEAAELATAPEGAVEAGKPVKIPVSSGDGDTVIVSGLPEGVEYDSKKKEITGTPTAPGDYEAVVNVITADSRVLEDTVNIHVAPSRSTEPTSATPTSEEPTSATPTSGQPSTPTSGQPTSATPTSGQLTTQPAPTSTTEKVSTARPTSGQPTSGQATPEPTTKPSTPGSSEPSTSEPTSATPTSEEPTPTAKPTTPTSGRPTSAPPTSGQLTTQPAPTSTTEKVSTARPTSGQPTSGQTTSAPEPTTKPSTPGSSEPTSTTPTSGWVPTQPEPTSTTAQPTSAQPTSGRTTTAQPTSGQTTSAPEPSAPATSEPTAATPTSGQLTTQPQPTTTKPTSARPTTSAPQPTTSAQPAPSVDDFAWDKLTVQAGTTKVTVPSRKPSETVNVRVDGDAPEWLSVASDGQVLAEPGRDVKPGEYTVDVVSGAGERDIITVNVTAPVSDADRISGVKYKDSYVQAGKTNSSRQPIATIDRDGIEYKGQPLPAGTKFSTKSAEGTVDPDTGVVTVKAPLRTPAGDTIEIPVNFTYPDGTKGKADAVFHVDAGAQNETYKPAYQEGLGAQPGKTVVVPLLDGTFPVNEDNENIGQYALAPVYDENGKQLGADKAYKGWDVSIDPDTGAVYATAPDENPEQITVPVTVLYSDGTVSDKDNEPTVFARIAALKGQSLADSTEAAGYGKPFFDADGNIRMFPTGSMPPGATFEQTGLTALPVEVDPETGAITVKVSEDAPVGANFDIPLKLTLPDGSVQEITVPVSTKSEAANQVVSWSPVKVTETGTPVTVAPSQAPAGTTYALAASFDAQGWQVSVDPKTGEITVARNGDEDDPQAALIPVVVTFADGSQRVVEVPATTVRGTAAVANVEYPRVVINAGQTAILRPSAAGASFSLVKPIPGLRTQIDPVTGELTVVSYDGTVPGPRDIPVQVTFEDSSSTITSARVEVRTKSGMSTLAESTLLDDVSAVGRPDFTTRVTLPVPKKAADYPFSLGEFDAEGWEVSLDRARGVLEFRVPADAAGQVKQIPVNVRFADGSTGQFNVTVEVDGVAAGGSSQSNGSSKPSPWVWALAVLGLLGTAGKVLYDNCDKFQHFLEQWV